MKVLFAIGQDTSNGVQEKVLSEYKKKYQKEFQYKSEYYTEGVEKCLNEEPFDVLIINEKLENVEVDISTIDKITDLHPNLKVIFAIDDRHKEDEFTNRLYALGVYDGIFFNDFDVENLIDLLENPRTKKAGKDYYGIDEKIDDIDIKFQVAPIPEDALTQTIKSLEQSIKDSNLDEIFKQVNKEYTVKEMCYLLTMLPLSISEALRTSNNKIYSKYEKRVQKQIEKIEPKNEVQTEIKYIEKIKEIPVEVEKIKEIPVEIIKEVPVEKEKTVVVEKEIVKVNHVRYDSIIAVIGNSPAGKSYITWNLAYGLAQNYKVAVINIDDSSSANIYFGINQQNEPLHDIENKTIKQVIEEGVLINKNLTVYSGKFGERPELRRNTLTQLISGIRQNDNSIIIIDVSTGYSKNLIEAINSSNDILVTYSMDNVHMRMNDLLMLRLSEQLSSNNTIAVLNNAYRSSKEYKSIIDYLYKSKRFRDIVTISNCGSTSYDYIYSNTCNYLKDNNEFSRDIDVLINALKLQGKQQSNSSKKRSSFFDKLLRR